MKFLWQSNAPWAGTGYGQQTKVLLPALRELGHDPQCFAFYGLSGGKVEFDGYPVWPNSDFEPWGNDVIKTHLKESEVKVLITLMDLFVLNPAIWRNLPVPWVAWVPIDHHTIGYPTMDRLVHVDYPIAMSDFGRVEMERVGIQSITIPHAVDTEVFKPINKVEARQKLGIDPDCYLVGMVMANKGDRKQYPAQLEAVKRWMDTRPGENIKVYIHADVTDGMGGWDLKLVTKKLGLEGKVYASNQYAATVVPIDPGVLNHIYNSMDVLCNVSSGEGFGIPIIEAQACGVPVLTLDATSMPELTRYGYTVKTLNRILAAHFGFQYHLDQDDMVRRLEAIYRMANTARAEDARSWVIQNYSVPVVAQMWHGVLEGVREAYEEKFFASSALRKFRPQGELTDTIKQARAAMAEEAEAYGTYHHRTPEYEVVLDKLRLMGLQSGDVVYDLGAGVADLDRYLREHKWHGVYVPVDMLIDGTDLAYYDPPAGSNFIILEQVIEHLEDWRSLVERCEKMTGAVVIVTPNAEALDEHDKEDFAHQMAHVSHIVPDDLVEMGYEIELKSFTGTRRDTIVAWKRVREAEDAD